MSPSTKTVQTIMVYLYLILLLGVYHPVLVVSCLGLIALISIALAYQATMEFLSKKQKHGQGFRLP